MSNIKRASSSSVAAPKPTPEEVRANLAEVFGALIPIVEPKDVIGSDDASLAIATKLMSGDITDWDELSAIFGTGKRYADKAALAANGTVFRVRKIVERVRGSYNKDNDWAFEIVTEEDGEVQVLSLEKNTARDIMVFVVAAGLAKFGESAPLQLSAIELAETDDRPAGRTFYAFTKYTPRERVVGEQTVVGGP